MLSPLVDISVYWDEKSDTFKFKPVQAGKWCMIKSLLLKTIRLNRRESLQSESWIINII